MKKLFLFLVLAAFVISCGKKEETQQTTQENQQQLTQQQTQQPQTQTTEQTKQDESKKDEMKKEDEKKKEDAKKKDAEKKKEQEKQLTEKKDKEETSLQKIETNSSDIDFAPIFAKKCAKCHGKDLKGKKDGGPDLTDTKVQQTDDAKLIKIITNGVKAKNEDDNDMPSWKNKLTEDEIKAAVKFIKAHGSN